jgi:uncharacterized protein (DUF608 family)
MELGRDGRIRNLTINNNRTARTRIDCSPGSLLAIRAVHKGRISSRILQESSDLPFDAASIAAPFTPADNLTWRGLYPSAQYELDDPNFPLSVAWSAVSPVIPFDLEPSTLPLVMLNVHLRNSTNDQMPASLMFNWENLCGCTAGNMAENRGAIRPALINHEKDQNRINNQGPNALEFGAGNEVKTNADGHSCLAVRPQLDQRVTYTVWDRNKVDELRNFWHAFNEEGELENDISDSPTAHQGALCCSLTVPAQSARNVVLLFAWYRPQYEIDGESMGNAYANRFNSVRPVILEGLQNHQHYFRAVENWHSRLLRSSFPRWFQRMLINSNSVFSTNTLYTRENQFAMFESPADPLTGSLGLRFYSSLATLMFFPELEGKELSQLAETRDPQQPGRLCTNLGLLSMQRPNHGRGDDETLDGNAKFVLMVYRDFMMTGRRPILEHLFPRVKEAMQYLVDKTRDEDGIPSLHGFATVYPNWAFYGLNSYMASLWLVTIRAYVKLCRFLNNSEEAERFEALFLTATETFRAKLRSESGDYFRLYHDPNNTNNHESVNDACHSGQLVGQWYADFLCLGTMLPHEEITSALEAIFEANEHVNGAAEAHMPDGTACTNPGTVAGEPGSQHCWIPFAGTQYACLQMQHGIADRGLFTIQKIYKNTQVRRGRTFNQPLCWNLEENEACGPGMDRHMSAPYIWHALYALQGFHLNVAEKTLWIRPNLPRGVFTLTAPLLSPTGFGWMEFKEMDTEGNTYKQQLIVTFDSPVHVETIVLRVPTRVKNVGAKVVTEDGTVSAKHFIGSDGSQRLVEINFDTPILVNQQTRVTLGELPG